MKRKKSGLGGFIKNFFLFFFGVVVAAVVLGTVFDALGIDPSDPELKLNARPRSTATATARVTDAPAPDLAKLSFTDASAYAANANARSVKLEDVSCVDVVGIHSAEITIDVGNCVFPKYDVRRFCEYLLNVSEAVYTSHPETDAIIFQFMTHTGGDDANTTLHAISATVTKDVAAHMNWSYWRTHMYSTTKDLLDLMHATVHPDLLPGVY